MALTDMNIVCPVETCGWYLHHVASDQAKANLELHLRRCHPKYPEVEHEHNVETCTKREKLLIEAAGLVAGQRDSTYGPPAVNWGRIADALNAVYGPRLDEPGFRFTAADVAVIMIVTKLSRQVHVSKYDNWLDIAGYAACGAEVDANG